jgi:hypothetical protein
MGKLYLNFSTEYFSFNFTSTCTDINNLTIPKYGKMTETQVTGDYFENYNFRYT